MVTDRNITINAICTHLVLLVLRYVDPPILPELEVLLVVLPDDLPGVVLGALQVDDQLLDSVTLLRVESYFTFETFVYFTDR